MLLFFLIEHGARKTKIFVWYVHMSAETFLEKQKGIALYTQLSGVFSKRYTPIQWCFV